MKYISFINEGRSIPQKISFIYNNEKIIFNGSNKKNLYSKVIDWLYLNKYPFNDNNIQRKLLSKSEVDSLVKSSNMRYDKFHKIEGSEKYIITNFIKQYQDLIFMLNDFGVEKISINNDNLSDLEDDLEDDDLEDDLDNFEIHRFGNFNKSNFKASQSQEEVESIDFTKNPFMQAICVLGESGAGKSTTIENILEKEGHEFEFIIPSASTTGLLSQFSPSKSGYVPSKLGKMILNAYDNPTQLFTAVFDECHKSNVIEMINDELLQAISTKRNNGKRFISLDDDTADLYPGTEKHRGNILIPDNLGFIFISSKPDVILHNDDFFNRIDIVMLKQYNPLKPEDNISNISQLKLLSEEEKNSLKSNND
jgi:hypothetical protein